MITASICIDEGELGKTPSLNKKSLGVNSKTGVVLGLESVLTGTQFLQDKSKSKVKSMGLRNHYLCFIDK